jgi:hypothetical protein
MSVGNQPGASSMDSTLTGLASSARLLFEQIRNLNTQVNGGATAGEAYMQNVIGYASTGTSPQNPSGMTDAQAANYWVGLLWNLAEVYYGLLGQAVIGQPAASENFDQGLAPLWAGRTD